MTWLLFLGYVTLFVPVFRAAAVRRSRLRAGLVARAYAREIEEAVLEPGEAGSLDILSLGVLSGWIREAVVAGLLAGGYVQFFGSGYDGRLPLVAVLPLPADATAPEREVWEVANDPTVRRSDRYMSMRESLKDLRGPLEERGYVRKWVGEFFDLPITRLGWLGGMCALALPVAVWLLSLDTYARPVLVLLMAFGGTWIVVYAARERRVYLYMPETTGRGAAVFEEARRQALDAGLRPSGVQEATGDERDRQQAGDARTGLAAVGAVPRRDLVAAIILFGREAHDQFDPKLELYLKPSTNSRIVTERLPVTNDGIPPFRYR
ncbi:hypothetical protein AB0M43_05860 [Longispora sp. NPDC051575]|uniref:hypothetical protein n=1 Tax=Longispora sp. NPDC051575 TaxID=3154943 RepID=UPI0034490336